MGFLSGIVSGIGGIASTILGNNSARDEAQANRDFQQQMSDTSIQRRVADLKKAGLNPLLAVSNASAGASTPVGATAQTFKFNPQDMSALASARLVNAQAKAQEQQNSIFDVKADKLRLENELERENILNQRTIRDLNNAKTLEAKANILVRSAQVQGIKMSTEEAKRKIQLLDVQLSSIGASSIGQDAKFMSELFSSPGRAIGGTLGILGSGTARVLGHIFKHFNK